MANNTAHHVPAIYDAPPPSPQVTAAAWVTLTRYGATDLAPMLGLEGEQ